MEAALAFERPAVDVRERLAGFVDEVAERLPLRRQRENALLYVRGLVEHGGRKSLQPTLFRLEETPARYKSMQQFLADSPWEPRLLVRACAELVAPEIGVTAWVVDDTGIVKDGKHSPGVKSQYSGTLGKIGNCQITVSVHAVGERGTLPLGWSLYLREEWCDDLERRRKAKIPDEVRFQTKPELAGALCADAAGWEIPTAPILADSAYGDDTAFRGNLHALGLDTWSRCGRRRASTARRRPSPCRNATAPAVARGASHAPTASPSRCVRSPSDCQGGPGRRFLAGQRRPVRSSPAASPLSASSPPIPSATTISRRVRSG
jgi:SRSO17 transposase